MRPATGEAGRRRSRLPQESWNRRKWWRLPWTAGKAAVVEERELSWTVEMIRQGELVSCRREAERRPAGRRERN
ncbi:hypothetical protein OIU84_003373 [Salix udensis]|uniref:Uncharacterized protein n=1 Tax=Salix udensis TaxID=889485 RepID=A0AAD6K223_9ROSI|nr:hypothetical protein OIU84_003373 [Salix udensis]